MLLDRDLMPLTGLRRRSKSDGENGSYWTKVTELDVLMLGLFGRSKMCRLCTEGDLRAASMRAS